MRIYRSLIPVLLLILWAVALTGCKPEKPVPPVEPPDPTDTLPDTVRIDPVVVWDSVGPESFVSCKSGCDLGGCFSLSNPLFIENDSCRIQGFPVTQIPVDQYPDDIAVIPLSINPNNASIVLLSRLNQHSAEKTGFFLFDMCTGRESSMVLSPNAYGNFDWGKNGWILFRDLRDGILKIKGNGDSLMAVPTPSVDKSKDFYPQWSNDGKSIGYFSVEKQVYVIQDLNGNIQKEITGFNFGDWSPTQRQLVAWKDYQLGYYDIDSEIFTPLVDSVARDYFSNWDNTGDNILWYDVDRFRRVGIYLTNIHTGDTRLLIPWYTNKQYQRIYPVSDGAGYITALKTVRWINDTLKPHIIFDRTLSVFSADGECELVADFD